MRSAPSTGWRTRTSRSSCCWVTSPRTAPAGSHWTTSSTGCSTRRSRRPIHASSRHRGVPAERLERFADEDLPASAAFNESDVDDKPEALRRRRLDGSEIGEIVRNYRAELASLELVDESVGAVHQRLRDHCIEDETVIIVTSDNGFMHGEHRLIGGKYFAYEPSIRVPLIVSGPGIAPRVEQSLASNVDLAPTIAELAGASLLMPSDGRSLVPLLDGGGSASWGRAVYVEGHAPGDEPLRPTFDGVHTGDTLYVEYSDGSRELYDMRTDPDQLENLSSAPSADDLLERQRELLQQLRDCAGAVCASIGAELPVPETPDVGWLSRGEG